MLLNPIECIFVTEVVLCHVPTCVCQNIGLIFMSQVEFQFNKGVF